MPALSATRTRSIAVLLALVLIATVTSLAPPRAAAQSTPEITVTPDRVVRGQAFSLRADGCPDGPNNPVGSYRVELNIDFLPPPQLPGDPHPGSYSVTLDTTNLGDGGHVATWSLPADAPTLGGTYRVTGTCFLFEIGESVWFTYDSTDFFVSPDPAPVLTATPTTVAAGSTFDVTAVGCPAPQSIAADYRVDYTLTYLPPGGSNGSFQQTYSVGGSHGDHALTITIPASAPTEGGLYELSAICAGIELTYHFTLFTYEPIQLTVVDSSAPTCAGLVVDVDLGAGDQPTMGDDVILGTPGPDVIDALDGDDVICALGGRDLISAGPGDDLVYGGGGHDVVRGGAGSDSLYGQPGADQLRGGDGADFLFGGSGFDTLFGDAGDDFVQGSGGNDTMYGGDGDDNLYGKAGDDRIWGEAGDDEIYAAGGADQAWGGTGIDRIQGASGDDVLEGGDDDDVLYGQADADTLRGGAGDDVLYAASGDDVLEGGVGDDELQGAAGDDDLFGNDGDDLLYGQAGNDDLDGGAGTDTCLPGSGSNVVLNC